MIRTEHGSPRSQFCQIWNPTAGQSRDVCADCRYWRSAIDPNPPATSICSPRSRGKPSAGKPTRKRAATNRRLVEILQEREDACLLQENQCHESRLAEV